MLSLVAHVTTYIHLVAGQSQLHFVIIYHTPDLLNEKERVRIVLEEASILSSNKKSFTFIYILKSDWSVMHTFY